MVLPLYLAMTAAEMRENRTLPSHLGFMACHFSPYGTALSNCPKALPPGTMLILNDRTPICGHDPQRISTQLQEMIERFRCGCVLLDFQRPGVEETAALAQGIVQALSVPVGVSDLYAQDLDCPVFLPPVPPDVRISGHIAPWHGREIWLDVAMEPMEIILTPQGAAATPLPWFDPPQPGHRDEQLHCHYIINTDNDTVRFTLYRSPEDLQALLSEAAHLGITRAVGLWQELRKT